MKGSGPYAIREAGAATGAQAGRPAHGGKRGLSGGRQQPVDRGIAKAAHAQGADLAFTYQGDALKKRVEPLAEEVDGIVVGHCDVAEEATLDAAFAAVKAAWGSLDFVVHAIAFSDKEQLTGRYVDTTRTNCRTCNQRYSFTGSRSAPEVMAERRSS